MNLKRARDEQILRRRLDRFLSSGSLGGTDVARVIEPLQSLGQVFIFGGALRDIALEGNRRAPNDIDIVVRAERKELLPRLMQERSAIRNRFGGYRFTAGGWKFDAWLFEDTWAFRAGFVQPAHAEDLLKTTFFDWDAIAYEVSRARLIFRETYFDAIASGVVDINLPENPNPYGTALRALRIFKSGRARLSGRLARYVIDVLRMQQQAEEGNSAPAGGSSLRSAWLERAIGELDRRLAVAGDSVPVGLESEQLRLPS
jgi:hypothetical protein